MNKCHAITVSSDGSLCLVRHSISAPGENEVLIRVYAAGVNRGDIKQKYGDYPSLPQSASAVLGLEVSGVIEEVGSHVSQWQRGDRVCALLMGGGYAEYSLAQATHCLPIPQGFGFIEAAGLPETFSTVWQTLILQAHLRRGESLLLHGGASGIGVAAIQIASRMGVTVFASAGSERKCRACIDLGARHAINYRQDDFESVVMELTNGQGVDVVLDMVGAPYASKNVNVMADQARLVYVAGDSGGTVDFNVRDIMLRRLTITGSTLRHRSISEKREILRELERAIWPQLESGAIKPVIDKVFSLEQAQHAHDYLEQGNAIGKVVLGVR